MKILVTGATGFVGSQVVFDLLKAGHEVVCCVRNVNYAKKLFPDCKIISCDFLKDVVVSDWIKRLENIDVVINTVGIFYHPIKSRIWKTHYETPRALFDACVESSVKKIIHLSALGINNYPVDYAKSKLAADNYLQTLPISSVILRPSLIYGSGSYGGTSLFRGLAGLPFIIPVPGKGKQQFQPIFLLDLSQVIIKLIAEETSSHLTPSADDKKLAQLTRSEVDKKPAHLTPSADDKKLAHLTLSAVCREKINLKTMLSTLRNWLALPNAFIISVPYFFIQLGSFFWESDTPLNAKSFEYENAYAR